MAENLPRYAVTDLIARVSGMSRGRLEMRLLGECAEVSRFMPPQTAGEGDMAFLTNAAYAEAMKASRASLLIMREQDVEALFGSDEPGRAVLVCDNPYAFFAFASQILFHVETPAGIHPRAFVEEGAEVDPSATVEALAVVRRGARVGARTVIKTGAVVGEDTVVGEDCILYPNCVLERGTVVGNRCIFQPGCVIGGDGFGFARSLESLHLGGSDPVKTAEALLAAGEKYKIDIFAHPGLYVKCDIPTLARGAKELGIKLEINAARVTMSDEELRQAADIGAEFIIGSDAHWPSRVGDDALALAAAKRAGVEGSVVNIVR